LSSFFAAFQDINFFIFLPIRGLVQVYPKADDIDHEKFMSTKDDIFIPADTAEILNVKLAAECANGPID